MEEWRTLVEHPNYSISSEGNFKNNKTGRILKQRSNEKGYQRVSITVSKGVSKSFRIHRLVATYFIPNLFNKPEVDHIDEDKSNNHYENLRWTSSEQNRDYYYWNHSELIEYKGEKLPLPLMSRKYGFDNDIIYSRLNQGWSISKTFETPHKKPIS